MATDQTPPNTPLPSFDESTDEKEKGKENTYMKNSLDMLNMFVNGGDNDDKDANEQSQSNSQSKGDKDPSQNASSESPMEMTQSADTIMGPTDALSGAGGSFDSVAGGNNASLSPNTLVETVEANPELLMAL